MRYRLKPVFTVNTIYRNLLAGCFILCGLLLHAQINEVSYAPADSEFVMTITRVKTEVVFSITFSDSLVFDNISIERQPDFGQVFTQCTYISYADVKNKSRHVTTKDIYPYSASTDVSYRVKLTTKDGAIRTYPPVLLPAVSK